MSIIEILKAFGTTIPFLIALWIGVIGLSRKGRPGAWWCMLSGTCVVTLASVTYFLLIILLQSSLSNDVFFQALQLTSYGHSLGFFLFAVGFAVHGCKVSRSQDRISELEMMNLAQATELERLRNR